MKNFKQGFTLVELLIVIAIIGILAIGLIVALDPVEQTKRATDSNLIQAARQVKDASERYYTTNQFLPGCTVSPCSPAVTPGALSSLTAIVPTLVAAGELKTNIPSTTASTLYLSSSDGTSYAVCFKPTAKSNLSASLVASLPLYTDSLGTTPAPTGTACTAYSCYQCFK